MQLFGVWRNSTTFLYGSKFILQTDQKPLVSIFRNYMIDVSLRMQRITIRVGQYDFEPQHIPGKLMSFLVLFPN